MLTVKDVAIKLGVTTQFIRTGLQKGLFTFGSAEKVNGKYIYSIDENAFNKSMNMIRTVENEVRKELTLEEVIAAIDPMKIDKIELVADKKGQPMVSVWERKPSELQFYFFPATKGYQIHTINEFLRSLNLGLEIKFHTYEQYKELLNQCMELLDEKRKATA